MVSKVVGGKKAVFRRDWVEFIFGGPYSLAYINQQQPHPEATAQFNELINERLCRPCGTGDKWGLSDAGRVLRVLYMLSDKESGPWSLTQVRHFADMQRLTPAEIVEALGILAKGHLVYERPSARTMKWELHD